MKIAASYPAYLLIAVLTGCSGDKSDSVPPPQAAVPEKVPEKAAEKSAPVKSWTDGLTEGSTSKSATSTTVPAAPIEPGKEMVREQAGVGMGERGRGYGGGYIAVSVRSLWTTKEKLALDMIEHSMDLYKANDPDGRGPKTQAEFMQKIVKDNDIKLPLLPEGHRYVFDPATQELMVEHPKGQ